MIICSPVICPFPNTDPGGNYTISTLYLGNSGNDTSDVSSFGHWWSKTDTIPLYLIILLLPLLCFRSASFFARFTFLGKIELERSYEDLGSSVLNCTQCATRISSKLTVVCFETRYSSQLSLETSGIALGVLRESQCTSLDPWLSLNPSKTTAALNYFWQPAFTV